MKKTSNMCLFAGVVLFILSVLIVYGAPIFMTLILPSVGQNSPLFVDLVSYSSVVMYIIAPLFVAIGIISRLLVVGPAPTNVQLTNTKDLNTYRLLISLLAIIAVVWVPYFYFIAAMSFPMDADARLIDWIEILPGLIVSPWAILSIIIAMRNKNSNIGKSLKVLKIFLTYFVALILIYFAL